MILSSYLQQEEPCGSYKSKVDASLRESFSRCRRLARTPLVRRGVSISRRNDVLSRSPVTRNFAPFLHAAHSQLSREVNVSGRGLLLLWDLKAIHDTCCAPCEEGSPCSLKWDRRQYQSRSPCFVAWVSSAALHCGDTQRSPYTGHSQVAVLMYLATCVFSCPSILEHAATAVQRWFRMVLRPQAGSK